MQVTSIRGYLNKMTLKKMQILKWTKKDFHFRKSRILLVFFSSLLFNKSEQFSIRLEKSTLLKWTDFNFNLFYNIHFDSYFVHICSMVQKKYFQVVKQFKKYHGNKFSKYFNCRLINADKKDSIQSSIFQFFNFNLADTKTKKFKVFN